MTNRLHTCAICGQATGTASVLCSQHTMVADLAGLVLAGAVTDWPRGEPKYGHFPTHRGMMCSRWAGATVGWRAQLATLLAVQGVWLDDGGEACE